MYIYKDYDKFVSELNNIYNVEIGQKSETIKGKGIFEGKLLKKDLSITPYINNICSADCKFCSEKLERINKSDKIDCKLYSYEEKLTLILSQLHINNLFLSLSGKEPTESSNFLEMILKVFSEEEQKGLNVTQKVMYSNLSGFINCYDKLLNLISDYKLSRIETSRHHFNDEINQSIMGFRGNNKDIMNNKIYENIVKNVSNILPVKVVCVLQKSGISNITDIKNYIEWANNMGINEIVFRELSLFEDSVKLNKVGEYIRDNRVEIYDLINNLSDDFKLKSIFKGYYYFSFVYEYSDSIVTFEVSDYEEMIRHHNSNIINKLIYYPNKNLCLDWNVNNVIF